MKVKRYLTPILLILLNSASQISSQITNSTVAGECYSLNDSKYCGGSFGSYYLSRKTLVEGMPVTDVTSLDRAIDYYFGSPQDVRDSSATFHCNPQITWDGVYFPAFRSVFYCRNLLEDTSSKLCNSKNPVPPTCQSDCNQFVIDWQFLWGNDTACKSPGDSASKQAFLTQAWCNHSPTNGTQGQCILPKDSAQTVCGYSLPQDLPALCVYCTINPRAACCNSKDVRSCKNSRPSSKNQLILILSIVIGCLGIVGLVAGVWLYFKKKRQQMDVGESFKGSDLSIIPSTKIRSSTLETGCVTTVSSSLPTYTCVYPYEPTLPDELRILPHDKVMVLMTFEDGWGVGRNITRGGEGALPIACLSKDVVPSEAASFSRSSTSSSIPRRTSSKRESSTMRISQYSTKSS